MAGFRLNALKRHICLTCNKTSTLKYEDFLIYELITPQCYSADLNELLLNNQCEIIEGYSCAYCKAYALIQNKELTGLVRKNEESIINFLKERLMNLEINADFPENVTEYINTYNENGCIPSRIKRTIVKKTAIIKSPSVLVIHLSRSVFNVINPIRNSCRIKFHDILQVPTQHIVNNVCQFQNMEQYKLKSAITHSGFRNFGHYQCYRRKPNFRLETTNGYLINKSPMVHTLMSDTNTVLDYPIKRSMIRGDETTKEQKRYKKMKSTIMFPYWKISDSNIKEAKLNNLLNEKKSIYMLFYEKI